MSEANTIIPYNVNFLLSKGYGTEFYSGVTAVEMVRSSVQANARLLFIATKHGSVAKLTCIKFIFDGGNVINGIQLFKISEIDDAARTPFSEITSIKYDSGRLYLIDSGRSLIIVYSAEDVIEEAFADITLNRLTFIKTLGGDGAINDKNNFTNPSHVAFSGDSIYILDKANGAIKQYDRNFNWIDTIRKTTTLKGASAIEYNPDTDEFYTVDNSGTLIVFNADFTINRKVSDFIALIDETVLRVDRSDNIPNLAYITTTKRVLKKFISNDTAVQGFVNLTTPDFSFNAFSTPMSIITSGFSKAEVNPMDIIMVVATNPKRPEDGNHVVFFRNDDSTVNLLKNDTFGVYQLGLVNSEDYHQSIAYAELMKMYYNTLLFARMLTKKVKFDENSFSEITLGTEYLTESEVDAILNGETPACLGLNEVTTPDTVNRVIEAILGLQTRIAATLKLKKKDGAFGSVPLSQFF